MTGETEEADELAQYRQDVARLLTSGPGRLSVAREDFLIAVATTTLQRRLIASPFCVGENFRDVANYLRTFLGLDYAREKAGVMLFDTDRRLITVKVISEGSLERVSVSRRELFRAALEHNSSAVICWHSHPSNSARPSLADLRALLLDLGVAALLEIDVLDWVIQARGGEFFSCQRAGLLNSDVLQTAIRLHPRNAAERFAEWKDRLMGLWRLWSWRPTSPDGSLR